MNRNVLLPQQNALHFRSVLFHSTPFLDRRRRTQSDFISHFKIDYKSKRRRRAQAKHSLMSSVSSYVDSLFQNWRSKYNYDELSSRSEPRWLRSQHSPMETFEAWTINRSSKFGGRGGFKLFDDDSEFEAVFESGHGDNRYCYWSSSNDENFQYYTNQFRSSRNRRRHTEENFKSMEDYDLSSERAALGLSSSGPLKLDQVKHAYRVCAMKWHPDRHPPGSSKVAAEEKFKSCTAAYQTLCTQLSPPSS